jgi:membrane protein YdbS with pleckstrin-like domain
MIASMINLNNLNYDTSLSHTSSVLSIIIIVFIAIAIVLEIHVIRKHKGRYQLDEFNLRYGVCIEGLNTEIFIGRYWNPLSLIRWAITNLIMIFFRDYCVAQIFVLLMISVIFQILLLSAKPMEDEWDQRMAMIIEVSVSVYLYALISLTDYMGENKLRIEIGWVLALLTAIVVGINIILFLLRISCKAIKFMKLAVPKFLSKPNRTVSTKPDAKNNLTA